MHVYGELTGKLKGSGTISGFLSATKGISGLLTIPSAVGVDIYDGSYEVTPKAWTEQTLPTKNKIMADDVTVFRIPYYETSNVHDGLTVFIAEDING